MIYLPLLQSTDDGYKKHMREIRGTYGVWVSRNYMDNPLCMATNDSSVEEQLKLCPDHVTNENQLKPLLEFSEFAFIQMRFVDDGSYLRLIPDKASKKRQDQEESTDQKKKIKRLPSTKSSSEEDIQVNLAVSNESDETRVYVEDSSVKNISDNTSIGLGLFARKELHGDEVIARFIGREYSKEEYWERVVTKRTMIGYALIVNKNTILDCHDNAKVFSIRHFSSSLPVALSSIIFYYFFVQMTSSSLTRCLASMANDSRKTVFKGGEYEGQRPEPKARLSKSYDNQKAVFELKVKPKATIRIDEEIFWNYGSSFLIK